MSKATVLIVDDDRAARRMVRRALELENISSAEADSGSSALQEVTNNFYDLIILDINMDDLDGFEVIQHLRKKDISTPIFLLSGRAEDHDKILGYGIGADAYITKPFSPAVLSAMVKSQLKKSRGTLNISEDIISRPPFRFDKKSLTLYKNDSKILLSSKETQLIRYFLENKDVVFTKDQLYSYIWNETAVSDNNIMVFIRKLRTKIEDDPNNPKYLRTVWGTGYMFTTESDL